MVRFANTIGLGNVRSRMRTSRAISSKLNLFSAHVILDFLFYSFNIKESLISTLTSLKNSIYFSPPKFIPLLFLTLSYGHVPCFSSICTSNVDLSSKHSVRTKHMSTTVWMFVFLQNLDIAVLAPQWWGWEAGPWEGGEVMRTESSSVSSLPLCKRLETDSLSFPSCEDSLHL